jgi:hypothetical protein
MEQKQRTFSIWYAVLAMMVLVGIQAVLLAPHPENVSYSQFKALVKARTVSDLVLYKNTILGTVSPTGLDTILSKQQIEDMKRSGDGVHRFVRPSPSR